MFWFNGNPHPDMVRANPDLSFIHDKFMDVFSFDRNPLWLVFMYPFPD
jgi:hypothetical protein